MRKIKRNQGLIFSTLVAMAITLNGVNAQTYSESMDSLRKLNLDQIVISASRYEQKIGELGRSITVIGSEEIEKSMLKTVGELLANQQGVHLTGIGQNPGAQQKAFLRGANSYHTIVMIDGIRVSDPSSADNGLDLTELSLDNVERIEIVRGSHGTIYGSSAIGGVINIITRKNFAKPINLIAKAEAGILDKNSSLISNNLFLNYSHEAGWYINFGTSGIKVKGLDATVDTVTSSGVFNHRDKDDFFKIDLVSKIGYRKNNTDAFISYKNSYYKTDLDQGAYRDDDNRYLTYNRDLLNAGINYNFGKKFSVSYLGGYSSQLRADMNDSSIVDNSGNYDHQFSNSKFYGSFLTQEITTKFIGPNLQIISGIGNSKETMSNYNYVYSGFPGWQPYISITDLDSLNLYTKTYHVFLHADINGRVFSERFKSFSLGLGSRFSTHNKFGNNFVYEIIPSYKLTDFTLLYVSISTGFNAPSLYQLYEPSKGYGSFTNRGNENLLPETSISYEFGLKSEINSNTSWNINFFKTEVKNLIEYVFLWDKNIGIDTLGNDWMRDDYRGDTYINLVSQKIIGIEFDFKSQLHKKILINANFTLLNGTTEVQNKIDTTATGGHHIQMFESGNFISGKNIESFGLTRRPSGIFNFDITYMPLPNLIANLNTRFIGSRNDVYFNSSLKPYGALAKEMMKPYQILNFSLRFESSKNYQIGFKINNILDTQYSEINGYRTIGRAFYMNLSFKL